MTILITGGAGFIGSHFVLDWLKGGDETVVNLDALTYAGNLANLASLASDARHIFVPVLITPARAYLFGSATPCATRPCSAT